MHEESSRICRPKTSLGTRTVSESLRLQVTGEEPAADQQGNFAATAEGQIETNGASSGPDSQPGSRPDALGNSRGKRRAMKFVNKIASKEKYTQVRLLFCLKTAAKFQNKGQEHVGMPQKGPTLKVRWLDDEVHRRYAILKPFTAMWVRLAVGCM